MDLFQRPFAQPPDPVHHHITTTIYHISSYLILTSSLPVVKVPHSHLYFSSPNRFSSEVVNLSELHQSHKCGMQPPFEYPYILKIILPNPSYFIFSQCLYSTAVLHLSPIYLTHLLPKELPIPTHILIYFSSKLLIYLPFCSDIYIF